MKNRRSEKLDLLLLAPVLHPPKDFLDCLWLILNARHVYSTDVFMLFGLFLEGDSKSHNSCSLRGSILALNSQYHSLLWFSPPPSLTFSLLFSHTSSLSLSLHHPCLPWLSVSFLLRSQSLYVGLLISAHHNTDQKNLQTKTTVPSSSWHVCFAVETSHDTCDSLIIQHIARL